MVLRNHIAYRFLTDDLNTKCIALKNYKDGKQ